MRDAISQGDANRLCRAAQTLKGTGGIFGASAMIAPALRALVAEASPADRI
jgi:hypothetical protein